jgi:hypothetical protein
MIKTQIVILMQVRLEMFNVPMGRQLHFRSPAIASIMAKFLWREASRFI